MTRPQLCDGTLTPGPQATPSAQLPAIGSAIQMMENSLFSLESVIATWQSSSPSSVMGTIFTISCGLLLFFLLLSCLESNPSLPPPRERRNIRKVRNLWPRLKKVSLFSIPISTSLNHLQRHLRWERIEHYPSRKKPSWAGGGADTMISIQRPLTQKSRCCGSRTQPQMQ